METTMEDDGGRFVKEARTYLGLDREKFGDLIGVKKHTIWRYERGDPVPRTTRLAIERVLIDYEHKHKRAS